MANWKTDMTPLMESVVTSGTESQFSDWHATITIQFGELIESGFDWGKDTYYPAFTGASRTRLNQKIEDRFYWREICAVPPGKFKHFLMRKLNEIMPKYKMLYDEIDSGNMKVFRQETYNGKSRNVYSEYPQSQLQGSADYATNANDAADGHTRDGAPIDMAVDFQQRYNDVDVMILDELDVCFLSLMTLNVNAGV